MSLLLGDTQAVLRSRYADEAAFAEALLSSPVLAHLAVTPAQKRAARRRLVWGIAGATLAVALILLAIFKPFSGTRIDPDSTLGKLGLSGSTAAIKTVALYGEALKPMFEDAVYQSRLPGTDSFTALYLPGAAETVALGSLSDLTDFALLTNLEALALAGNAVGEITPLLELTRLKKLDLSAQHYDGADPESREASSLSLVGISRLTSLEYLNLAYGNFGPEEARAESGLLELKAMPGLKTLVLDRSSQYVADYLGDVDFDIVYIGTEVTDYPTLKAALEDPDCYEIAVRAGSVITIPGGEDLTLPAGKSLMGSEFELVNEGTLRIGGWLECGLNMERNRGTLIVESGGCYAGGMSDCYNEGAFIVEAGGLHSLTRGKQLVLENGSYRNDGSLFLGAGGALRWNGGTFENNGLITVQTLPEEAEWDWFRDKMDSLNGYFPRITGTGRIEYQEGGEW